MNESEFIFWLQGYLEDKTELDTESINTILERSKLVQSNKIITYLPFTYPQYPENPTFVNKTE